MSSAQRPTGDQVRTQVQLFTASCIDDPTMLSDTWMSTIRVKGADYTTADLEAMRRPGSSVSLQVISHHQFTDAAALDLSDPIQQLLMERGDSTVGDPFLDVEVGGNRVSSHYAKDIPMAAMIIRELEARGITQPTVMEVGGGMGLLAYALRQYFGDALTLAMVDIPQTLEYQAYMLRRSFPSAPVTFRPGLEPVELISGGINFINAYALEAQNDEIDVFINIDSMAEMKGETANQYLSYANRNLRPSGFIFFMNTYGMATGSVRAASEYDFGPGWRVSRWFSRDGYTYSCAAEIYAGFILSRHATAQGDDLRRELRIRFNSAAFDCALIDDGASTGFDGWVLNAETKGVTPEKSHWSPSQSPTNSLLAEYPVLPDRQLLGSGRVALDSTDWPQSCGAALRRFQFAIIDALRGAEPSNGLGSAQVFQEPIERLLSYVALQRGRQSDYLSCYAAAALAGLESYQDAKGILEEQLRQSSSSIWLLRGAWISLAIDEVDTARDMVSAALKQDTCPSWLPMGAVLLGKLNNMDHAGLLLDSALMTSAARSDLELSLAVFRAACLLDCAELALRAWDQVRSIADAEVAGARNLVLDSTAALGSGIRLTDADSSVRDSLRDLAEAHSSSAGQSMADLRLMVALNCLDRARAIANVLEGQRLDDYYTQGQLVGAFLSTGDVDSAARCAERSVRLRATNSKHDRFLGSTFFDAGQYDLAYPYLDAAARLTPEDVVTQGYATYSGSRGFQGSLWAPERTEWIFQRDQSFYYSYGPRPR